MKKFLIMSLIFMIGTAALAEYEEIETNVDMKNFWEKNGKKTQKLLEVGTKVINANRLEKRIPLQLIESKQANAASFLNQKLVVVTTGIMPYIDNDDELAFIIGHEIAHSLDAYEGPGRRIAMRFNVRSYEYKADLVGLDLMTKAGYNPIAGITELYKWPAEPLFDFVSSHPKPSRRTLEMYKYIYKKYPEALQSEMTKNVNYQNFLISSQKEITQFKQEEKIRENIRRNKYDL